MAVTIHPLAKSAVSVGGTAVIVAYGPVAGGFITNPSRAIDQGLASEEDLYISLIPPAGTTESATTYQMLPGETFMLPVGVTMMVSVNALSSGHKFSGIVVQPQPVPVPTPGPFPPSGPVTLLKTIRSYLYEEYDDDEALQAFVAAYNDMTQGYVDWFNTINIPIYTNPNISGAALDWVAAGLYGMLRPSLASGSVKAIGAFNTYVYNGRFALFNAWRLIGPTNFTATSDDTFRRILTWHFYKGDGKVFNIRWLKRRVMRFLFGTNGIDFDVDQTYQVSVTFGVGNQVNINILNGVGIVLDTATFNKHTFNGRIPLNGIVTSVVPLTPITNAEIFKEAVEAGVLELPFQYTYVVNIVG